MAASLNMRIAMVFLLFFRARHAFFARYEHADDGCYVHWLNTLVGLPPEGCAHGSYLPGTALLWLPAGILGRLLAVATDMPHRPYFDVLIGFTAFACWGVSAAVLTRMDRKGGWLFLLNVPVLYYCTSHTHIAHAAECLLGALFLFAIERRAFVAAAFLTVWLAATRLNDVGITLVLLGALADTGKLNRAAVFACAAVAGFAVAMGFWFGYNGDTLPSLVARTNLARAGLMLFGSETGVALSQSYFLFLLAFALYRWRSLTWAARGAVVWFVFTLYFVTLMHHGNDFGQRYTIGACLAMLLIHRDAPARWWCACGAAWMTLQTWVYQTPPYEVPMQLRTLLRLFDPVGLVRPFALSPLGMLVFSTFRETSLFASYRSFSSAALYGVRLWALALGTLVAITTIVFRGRLPRPWRRRASPAPAHA